MEPRETKGFRSIAGSCGDKWSSMAFVASFVFQCHSYRRGETIRTRTTLGGVYDRNRSTASCRNAMVRVPIRASDVTCATCHGRRTIPCPVCEGAGFIGRTIQCPHCSGDKTITCPFCLDDVYEASWRPVTSDSADEEPVLADERVEGLYRSLRDRLQRENHDGESSNDR